MLTQLTYGITSRKNKRIFNNHSTLTSIVASSLIVAFFFLYSFIKREELVFIKHKAWKILMVMSLLFISGRTFSKHQCNLSATIASVFNQPPSIIMMCILESIFMNKSKNIYEYIGIILLTTSFILVPILKDKSEHRENKLKYCLFLFIASIFRGLGNFLFNFMIIDDVIKSKTCSYAITAHLFNMLIGCCFFIIEPMKPLEINYEFFLVSFVQGIFFSSIILLTTLFIASKRFIYTSIIHLVNDFCIDFYLKNKITRKRLFIYFISFVGFLFYKNKELIK